jgi:DNA-binding MarR family transcriptional regulator
VKEPEEDTAAPSPRVRIEPNFATTWPGASPLATECVLNLGVLSEQMAAFGEDLARQHRIPSRAAFNVLAILEGAGEPLPPSIIAERMIVSRPTLTGVLRTLERRGMIRRLPHPTDGRMALISIAPHGRAAVAGLRPALHQAEKRWLDCLTEEEQRELLGMVARLQANALAP